MLGREEPAQDVETGRFLADEQYSQAKRPGPRRFDCVLFLESCSLRASFRDCCSRLHTWLQARQRTARAPPHAGVRIGARVWIGQQVYIDDASRRRFDRRRLHDRHADVDLLPLLLGAQAAGRARGADRDRG